MRRLVLVCVVLTFAAPAARGLAVGDKPTLDLRALDGSPVNFAGVKGKMILVDFFGPGDISRLHQDRLLDLYKKQADNGLVVIGVYCDKRADRAAETLTNLRLPWNDK